MKSKLMFPIYFQFKKACILAVIVQSVLSQASQFYQVFLINFSAYKLMIVYTLFIAKYTLKTDSVYTNVCTNKKDSHYTFS